MGHVRRIRMRLRSDVVLWAGGYGGPQGAQPMDEESSLLILFCGPQNSKQSLFLVPISLYYSWQIGSAQPLRAWPM